MKVGPLRNPIGASVWLACIVLAASPTARAGTDGQAAKHPWIGQPAPEIELVTTTGETVSLSEFRSNKFVVLHFAASW